MGDLVWPIAGGALIAESFLAMLIFRTRKEFSELPRLMQARVLLCMLAALVTCIAIAVGARDRTITANALATVTIMTWFFYGAGLGINRAAVRFGWRGAVSRPREPRLHTDRTISRKRAPTRRRRR